MNRFFAKSSLELGLKSALSFAFLVTLSGCFDQDQASQQITDYKAQNPVRRYDGQVNFSINELGALSLGGLLANNIMPQKVYGTALLLEDIKKHGGTLDGSRLPDVMRQYGFLRPAHIENWITAWAPEPKITGSLGFVSTTLKGNAVGIDYELEVSTINCSSCHGGTTYDNKGNPTGNAWIGSPNTSLNFDGFFGDIYNGLSSGIGNQTLFMSDIRKAFPDMSDLEAKTIQNLLLPQVASTLQKMAPMHHVLPYDNGGPGLSNGVAAFKRDSGLMDPYKFDAT